MQRNPIPANADEAAIYAHEASEARDVAAFDELLTDFRKNLLAGAKDKLETPGEKYWESGQSGPMVERAPVHAVLGTLWSDGKHEAIEAAIYALLGAAAAGANIKDDALALVESMGCAYAMAYHRDYELRTEDDFDIEPAFMGYSWLGAQ